MKTDSHGPSQIAAGTDGAFLNPVDFPSSVCIYSGSFKYDLPWKKG